MISSQDREIQALVADVRDGKLLLPEMQRGYVWKSTQVRDLFDSLYRNYPSGQLLVWETDDLPHVRTTSVDGVERVGRTPQLLLDGQQRLTSLTAIMLGLPLQMRDVKRPIDIVFNLSTEQFAVAGVQHRGENSRWISLSRLFTKGAMAVLMEIKLDPADPESQQIYERLTRLDNIKHYKYRVILLERLDYETVTNIFVRINSGGTTLSTADLALAQISSRWKGVTDELGVYLDSLRARGLEMDAGLLLRAIAVFITGQSTLTRFFRGENRPTIDQIKSTWQRVRTSMDRAVDFLVGNCKIDQLGLLPTNYVLVPVASYFDRAGEKVEPTRLRELQRWVYMALLWNRYSGASETALEQDVAALSRDNPILAMIQNIEDKVGHRRLVNERDLQGQRKNSSAMLLYYVLLRHNNAADWFSGVAIDGAQEIEIQNIFPKTILRHRYNLKRDGLVVDQIANMAIFFPGSGGRIAKRSPEKYLSEIDGAQLRAQYIPSDPKLWTADQFEQFIQERRSMIADGINKLFASLSEDPALWPTSDAQVLESRVDAIEHSLRELISDRLGEAHGADAWKKCVPGSIQRYVEDRKTTRVQAHPYEAGQYDSLEGHLRFCQFSDYPKIIRANAALFVDIFGSSIETGIFDPHIRTITNARNGFKHNNELNRSELAAAEASLVWFEECLHRYELLREQADEETVDEEDASTLVE